MARGAAQASTVARREAKTRDLFNELAAAKTAQKRSAIMTELVELNLPLCDALATRYMGRGVDYDDLVQVARTALWVAIQRFRPCENRSLASYAVPTITGELKRYFRDHCWVVRPPRQIQDLGSLTFKTTEDLEQSSGHRVSVEEIGKALGVDSKQVAESIIARAGYRPLSLDASTGDSAPVGSFLTDDEDIASELTDRLALRRALSVLSDRDRQVLIWRFEEDLTQSEIAARLGLSQMQVSRVIRRILDQTRERLEAPEQLAS
ncbi:MAG TPA: sigma-70 family RNA polymerase sigma factor [Propionibacteriaceae bacterium]|nr:sigma-70 family RNA polymerase sigma factor [Propionibacteriaceae bacterium]